MKPWCESLASSRCLRSCKRENLIPNARKRFYNLAVETIDKDVQKTQVKSHKIRFKVRIFGISTEM